METAKIVSDKPAKAKPAVKGDGDDVLLDLEERTSTSRPRPQRAIKQHPSSAKPSSTPSRGVHEEESQRKPLWRIQGPNIGTFETESPSQSTTPKRRGFRLRFGGMRDTPANQPHAQKRKTEKRSRQSRPRSPRDFREFRDGRLVGRVPRSSSSQEGLPRVTSLRRMSMPRSSSERQYSADVLLGPRISARSSSRRWHGDNFQLPEPEGEEELENFFRFMQECTRAALMVLGSIPEIISRLPEMTMDIWNRLLQALRGAQTPQIEAPRDEQEIPRTL